MQKRLETDTSLSQFAGQFVPLKVVTKGEQWQQWASKYKREGSSIPIIYVVRADGEQLYGKSGALSGDALPKLLMSVAQQSGRIFGEKECQLLESCNHEAELALSDERFLDAAIAITPVSKLGELGGLQSYAEPAIKANEIAKQIGDHALEVLKQAEEKIDDPERIFEGVVDVSHVSEFYSKFPATRQASGNLLKEVRQDKVQRELLKPAKELVKARFSAGRPKKSDKKRAVKSYELILKKYGETPAAEIARRELELLDPKSEFLVGKTELKTNAQSPTAGDIIGGYDQEQTRSWSDATGKFSVDAKLVEVTDEFVRLKTAKGKEIKVPVEKLSDSAKEYLDSRK